MLRLFLWTLAGFTLLVLPSALIHSRTFASDLSPWKKAVFLNFRPLPDKLNLKIRTGVESFQTNPYIPSTWWNRSIGLTALSSNTLPCSRSIVVAVVDTGIDYTHPDLVDNIWINPGESGLDASGNDKAINGIDDDGNGFIDDVIGWDFVNDVPLPYDVHGHGTHISGIIASASKNQGGVRGVCPNARIMPLKYYANSGLGDNNLRNTVRAIQYAIKNGANIINYSGGGLEPSNSEFRAIEAANKAGILFVAAAGNEGRRLEELPYYPASYDLPNILAVAAIDSSEHLLSYSNFGLKANLGAPGRQIWSDLPDAKSGEMSGTSQATAFVSGAAALLMSQIPRASRNVFEIRKALISGSKPLTDSAGKALIGGGILYLPGSIQITK